MKLASPTRKPVRPRYSIEALNRGLQTLALFSADRPTLSFTDIVQNLGCNKSTAFRVLSTLEASGYLLRDERTRRYRPGLKVLQLGFTALSGLEVRQVAGPALERLAAEVGETASLAVLDGVHVVYVDRVRNRAMVGVVLGIGSRAPAHCTSLGKALLADLPPRELDRRLAQVDLAAPTARTITSYAQLKAELARVRRRGYALADEEMAQGLRGASAPVRDASGRAVAAINISGMTNSLSRERLRMEIVPAVVRTALEISLALGYRPDTPK